MNEAAAARGCAAGKSKRFKRCKAFSAFRLSPLGKQNLSGWTDFALLNQGYGFERSVATGVKSGVGRW